MREPLESWGFHDPHARFMDQRETLALAGRPIRADAKGLMGRRCRAAGLVECRDNPGTTRKLRDHFRAFMGSLPRKFFARDRWMRLASGTCVAVPLGQRSSYVGGFSFSGRPRTVIHPRFKRPNMVRTREVRAGYDNPGNSDHVGRNRVPVGYADRDGAAPSGVRQSRDHTSAKDDAASRSSWPDVHQARTGAERAARFVGCELGRKPLEAAKQGCPFPCRRSGRDHRTGVGCGHKNGLCRL